MGKPSIPRGSDYMFNAKWEGNGGGQRVGKYIPFTDNGTIAKSCIFNRGDSANLIRTVASTSNRTTFTISLWFKIGITSTGGSGSGNFMWATDGVSSNEQCYLYLGTNNQLGFQMLNSAGSNILTQTCNRTVEDTGTWHHVVAAIDTTQSTNTNKLKLYLDGDLQSSFSYSNYDIGTNGDCPVNQENIQMAIGETPNSNYHFDGYIAEVNFIDGTAYGPETFGITDTSTGRWVPKSLGSITYGTNGVRLTFANSAGQTIGDDTSGNGNDLTVNNLVASDITTDSPTQNFATLSPNFTAGTVTLSEGNLTLLGSGSSVYGSSRSTFEIDVDDPTGYYFEARNTGSARDNINIGFQDVGTALSASAYGGSNFYGLVSRGGGGSNQYWRILGGSTDVTTSVAHADNDWIGVAIKQGKVWFAINNTYVLSGNPVTGATPFLDISAFAKRFYITIECFQNNKLECNFGQKSLNYSAPSGYVSIQQDNFPDDGKGIPDFVWIKDRDNTYNYELYDTTRGVQDRMTAETDVEATITDGLQKFLKGGFQIEDRPGLNTAGSSYISWNWLANGGTTSANTDGSGATTASVIQANQTAGFSIVTFTGTGSQTKIAHGLSSAPEWIMIKNRTVAEAWHVYLKSVGATHAMFLGGSDAKSDSTNYFNDVEPTNSVFTVNSSAGVNQSTKTMLAYCWHSVPGYSAFGSYYTDGNADGPFIYTGFKPKWIMFKSEAAVSWYIVDNLRSKLNPVTHAVNADSTAVEHTIQIKTDFLSNGFKVRATGDYIASQNSASHDPYHYMAFAEHPFHGNGVNPVTAR